MDDRLRASLGWALRWETGLALVVLIITIVGFTLVYAVLAVIEVRLMLQAIGKGPDAHIAVAGAFTGPSAIQSRPAPATPAE